MPNHSLGPSIVVVDSESPVMQGNLHRPPPSWMTRIARAGLTATMIGAVAVWLIPIKSALWFDETISYWQISSGLGPIWNRQGLSFPAYSYILWAWTKLFGISELALRIPSTLAMVAAVFVLYLAARELFEPDVAVAACALFSLHPIVVFAAIDARQYAFAVLMLNCAILAFLRWTRLHSTRDAVLFGLSGGLMFYFHYLFGVTLLAFGVLALATKAWKAPEFRRQFTFSFGVFFLVMLPVFSRLVYMVTTRQQHVAEIAPRWNDLADTLAPGWIALFFAMAVLVAVVSQNIATPANETRIAPFACVVLGFLPLLVLFGVSAMTPIHVFVTRYLMVGMPGVALCWALLLSRIDSGLIRASFCLTLLAVVAQRQVDVPIHGSDASGIRTNSWKAAVAAANVDTSSDHAPVLVCSGLVESVDLPIPNDVAESGAFAPLSYYRITSPVVPLPQKLNDAAVAQMTRFLGHAAPAHQRFVVMAYTGSESILNWLDAATQASYSAKRLGIYDGVAVWEYRPR